MKNEVSQKKGIDFFYMWDIRATMANSNRIGEMVHRTDLGAGKQEGLNERGFRTLVEERRRFDDVILEQNNICMKLLLTVFKS